MTRKFCSLLGALLVGAAVLGTSVPAHSQLILTKDKSVQLSLEASTRSTPLTSFVLGAAYGEAIRLSGVRRQEHFEFDVRRDEIVTDAEINLHYMPSPALLQETAQLNIYLNSHLQQSIALTRTPDGRNASAKIKLDAKLFKDHNRLTFEFVGEDTRVCVNPVSDAIWLVVDKESELTLVTQKIRVNDDLAFLPVPFLDVVTGSQTHLPVVFAAVPDDSMRTAAAIFASWAGVKTEWREIDFPVHYGEAPADGHYVVFATNESRPEFIRDYPQFEGPTIAMADAPESTYAKMLVIGGKNSDELITAVQALATSPELLTGRAVRITGFKEIAPRKAYDAPNWIDTSRVTTFKDLMKYEGQFTATGLKPATISVDLILPPDLFLLSRSSIPMNLKYNYSKPAKGALSQLRFKVNGALVQSYALDPNTTNNTVISRLPAVNSLRDLLSSTSIPTVVMRDRNKLDFMFEYSVAFPSGTPQECRTVSLIPNHVDIDPRSTLDFTGLHHYAQMPNVGLYSRMGFPFTKFADLAQTLVLTEKSISPTDMRLLLNAMARFGSNTGYPSIKVEVKSAVDAATAAAKDILVIGALPDGFARPQDEQSAAIVFDGMKRRVTEPFETGQKALQGDARSAPNTRTEVRGDGPMAAIIGFESPFAKRRSVVALLTDRAEGAQLLAERLTSSFKLEHAKGSFALITNSGITNRVVGETYYVGDLPWYDRIWAVMLDRPLLLVLCALLCALILGTLVYGFMRLWVKYRYARTLR